MMIAITRRMMITMIVFSILLQAQHYTAKQVMQNIRETYLNIADARARFVQTTTLRFANSEQVQTGVVMIKGGNKYRVETNDQIFVANGKTVWIVTKSNSQVLIDSYKENNRSFSPEKFLTGLPEDFMVKDLSRENELLKISLEPKKSNAQTRNIRSLTAWVRPATWVVEKIVYTDQRQNQIEISLSQVVFNTRISDSEFEFTPTDQMKVVDLRRLK
jgi:outer membrane lipoprotein-sorting protein